MLGGSAHLCGKASTKTNVHRVDSLSGGFDSGEQGGIQNLGLVGMDKFYFKIKDKVKVRWHFIFSFMDSTKIM